MKTSWKFFGIILGMLLVMGCEQDPPVEEEPDLTYKNHMKDFIMDLSAWARTVDTSFIVVPQNGQELVTETYSFIGFPDLDYLAAIDGLGREDLFYGYNHDDEATPPWIYEDLLFWYEKIKIYDKVVMVTDYVYTPTKVDNSYAVNDNYDHLNFISLAAPSRDLDVIPAYPADPHQMNSNDIEVLLDAENYLYLLDFGTWSTSQDLIDDLVLTNYDVIVLDLFFNESELSPADLTSLKTKSNGGNRLVLAYMSIGEAEDYRYYWNQAWETTPPDWLLEENPEWAGNYKVEYWRQEWQNIIYGSNATYLKKIIDAGFDGVYLDIIDAFEYFEELND